MRIENIHVLQFGSSIHPDGINADIVFSCDMSVQAYRPWDDKQWYVYDLSFKTRDIPNGIGIADLDRKYPIPDGEVVRALNKAVDQKLGTIISE